MKNGESLVDVHNNISIRPALREDLILETRSLSKIVSKV